MIKIAAMGDLHMNSSLVGFYQPIFEELNSLADILVLCGDLTDKGSEDEAKLLVHELSFCKIPVIGVLGNHEYTQNHQDKIRKILSPNPIHLLDGDPFT